MNPLKSLWQFIKSLFPKFNRKQRRRFWYEQRRKGMQRQSLLARYHILWAKRPHGLGWWVRARRISLAA